MYMRYLIGELQKEIDLQNRHTDLFLEAKVSSQRKRRYIEEIVLPTLEKDQDYQSHKVTELLEKTIKEQDAKWKNNTNELR